MPTISGYKFVIDLEDRGVTMSLSNRILAGLSKNIIVTEARKRSGSLITANIALEENRNIFAVPGPVSSPLSEGPNELIAAD